MKIIFFENCVSPHQLPYMEVLAEHHDVTLVAPEWNLQERSQMGWNAQEDKSRLTICIAPSDEKVRALLAASEKEPLTCIFAGIACFKEVKHWLQLSLAYDVKRGVVTEAPYTYRWPLWVHRLSFLYRDYRFCQYIDYIFAIGHECESYYRSWSKRWKVVPFAYCVSDPVNSLSALSAQSEKSEDASDIYKICFVGSLSRRKNVKLLLEAVALLAETHPEAYAHCQLTLVGDGEERPMLEALVDRYHLADHVKFWGTLPMEEARKLIAQNHVLVLPSLHDGWGAVVNEALMAGTRVWCSNRCGAKDLIANSTRGEVFGGHDVAHLCQIMANDYKQFAQQPHTEAQRTEIRQWALEHIGAEAVAKKMEEALRMHEIGA